MKRSWKLAVLVGGSAALVACTAADQELPEEPGDGQRGRPAHLNLVLEVEDGASPLWMEVDSAVALSGSDRERLIVQQGPFPVRSGTRQLAHGELPAGDYSGIEIGLASVWSRDPEQGGTPLLVPERVSQVAFPIRLEFGEALELLLTLDLSETADGAIEFRPLWRLGLASTVLRSDTVLVGGDRAMGLAVIDRRRMRVHRTLLSGHAIVGLVSGRSPGEVVVLDGTDDELLALDVVSGRVRDRRRLPSGGQPVWAERLPDGSGFALSLAGRRSVELVAEGSLLERGAQATSRPPGRMASSPREGRLFVLLPEADALLVLSQDGREVISQLSLESGPIDLALDREGGRLAIACARAGRLMVVDAASLEIQASIFLGRDISAVEFDDQGQTVFAGLGNPARLQAVDLATQQAVSYATLPSAPSDLALGTEGRLLWIACPEAERVLAVDRFTLRIRSEFDVGGAPSRLSVPGRELR